MIEQFKVGQEVEINEGEAEGKRGTIVAVIPGNFDRVHLDVHVPTSEFTGASTIRMRSTDVRSIGSAT